MLLIKDTGKGYVASLIFKPLQPLPPNCGGKGLSTLDRPIGKLTQLNTSVRTNEISAALTWLGHHCSGFLLRPDEDNTRPLVFPQSLPFGPCCLSMWGNSQKGRAENFDR